MGDMPSVKGLKIIVLDDNILIGLDTQQDLLDRAATVVHFVSTKSDVIALLGREPIDVVVGDVNLHGADGIEFATAILNHGIGLVIASGYPKPMHLPAVVAQVGYVAKPFSAAQLVEAVGEAALRRSVQRDGTSEGRISGSLDAGSQTQS